MSTPISPVGTSRTDTMESAKAIPPEAGDVGGLLVERLRAWKHAVAYLEAYVTQTESVHRSLGKEYHKVLKAVDEPLREGHHFQQSVGGVASLFENIRANTVRLSTSHHETAGELKSTVLPILERLHKEIRDRQKHVQSESEKSAKNVAKTRNSTQAHIELLGQHASAFESTGGTSAGGHDGHHFKLHHSNTGGKHKPEFDPYLLRRGVLSRLAKQLHEENAQRQDLIGVQNHSQEFEAKIVQTIQQALAAFNQTMHTQAELQKQLYGDTVEKANAIPLDFEWVNFLSRNAETMIDPAAPKRTVETIRFPNEDHSSTKPLIEGALMRKGKIMRSYYQSFYVVTPSKYLHEFKDLDHLNREPEPELSLYLPGTILSALSAEGKFQITGKDAGSKLGTKHDFAFKASSYGEAQRWYEAISSYVNAKTDVVLAVTPPAGVSTTAIEKPPAYDNASAPVVADQGSGATAGTTPPVGTGNPMQQPAVAEKMA